MTAMIDDSSPTLASANNSPTLACANKGDQLASAANAGVATTQLIKPADIDTISALPEVEAATGSVDGFGSFLLGEDDKLVGGQGAPTLAFNYAPADNMAGEEILVLNEGGWPEQPGEVTLDTSSAEPEQSPTTGGIPASRRRSDQKLASSRSISQPIRSINGLKLMPRRRPPGSILPDRRPLAVVSMKARPSTIEPETEVTI